MYECLFQAALGTHDLGKFYYKPLRDPNGSIILATINFLRDPKVVSFNSGKWVPLSRLQRRQSQNMIGDISEEQDCIVSSINVRIGNCLIILFTKKRFIALNMYLVSS